MRIKSIGFDPEFFMQDVNGQMVPAWTFLPPQDEAVALGGDFKMYCDGAAVELQTPVFTHARRANMYRSSVREVREAMHEAVKQIQTTHPYLSLCKESVMELPEEYREAPEAKVFGCVPDQNCYTGEYRRIDPEDMGTIRVCGGHVHFAFDMTELPFDYKKELDPTFYFMSAFLADAAYYAYEQRERIVPDPRRAKNYGLPGYFRAKPTYPGIEYRSLDNHWLFVEHSNEFSWFLEDVNDVTWEMLVNFAKDPQRVKAINEREFDPADAPWMDDVDTLYNVISDNYGGEEEDFDEEDGWEDDWEDDLDDYDGDYDGDRDYL